MPETEIRTDKGYKRRLTGGGPELLVIKLSEMSKEDDNCFRERVWFKGERNGGTSRGHKFCKSWFRRAEKYEEK